MGQFRLFLIAIFVVGSISFPELKSFEVDNIIDEDNIILDHQDNRFSKSIKKIGFGLLMIAISKGLTNHALKLKMNPSFSKLVEPVSMGSHIFGVTSSIFNILALIDSNIHPDTRYSDINR